MQVLELTRPAEVVAGRELDPLGDDALRLLDVAAKVPARHVDEHVADELAVLVADRRR